MSSTAPERREGAAESVAGVLAALAVFVSAIAVVERPLRIAPVAMLVALVAVAMAQGRSRTLAAWAVAAAGLGWLLGMTIAVAADRPLF
ncbi:MAG TPA: hypothetical protein VK874_06470 [Gaiellaceae bacterium]|nr:hypothetical protein [Gaiellaceae bacterium]